MNFTKEEAQSIKENLTKVHAYVRENYVPRLRRYENVNVRFGDTRGNPIRYNMDKEFAFGFNYDGDAWFRAGGLSLSFDPESPENVYTSYSYARNLLIHWQAVKRLIEVELKKRDEERAALKNFTV